MTREEFIAGYCARSNITWEWLSQYRKVLSCDCGTDDCDGWAMVPKELPDRQSPSPSDRDTATAPESSDSSPRS